MYQSKCCPRETRGSVVASYQLLITFGILVSNLINYGVRNIEGSSASWRIVIRLGIAFSLPLGIGVLFLPESPRWPAGSGRVGRRSHFYGPSSRLEGGPHNPLVEDDFQEMHSTIMQQANVGTGSWWECFAGSDKPRVVYRTLLGCAVHFLQQSTGVNYFFYVNRLAC